jgi:hypothetical protein
MGSVAGESADIRHEIARMRETLAGLHQLGQSLPAPAPRPRPCPDPLDGAAIEMADLLWEFRRLSELGEFMEVAEIEHAWALAASVADWLQQAMDAR